MTTIVEGMTPAQFITALNNNFAELVTNWDVNQDADSISFLTLTTSTAIPSNLNYNLRSSLISYGQLGSNYISGLNSGFASTVQRFQDDFISDICPTLSAYGEPSALVSADGNQIDIWFTNVSTIYYSYLTDGLTFALPIATDIPAGYKRCSIMKEGNTYYMYVSGGADTTIHCFTSTDKINFTDQGEVIGLGAEDEWDESNLGNSFIFKDGTTYYLFYEGRSVATTYWKIGLATANSATGPFTKHGSNPIFYETDRDIQGPELIRVDNEIIKHNGNYYIYYTDGVSGESGPFYNVIRAYSSDLVNWTSEGNILNIMHKEVGFISYADNAFVQFKGKSYMFQNPSNQVDAAYIDLAVDNRTLAEMLALRP